jgi:putative membrane protein
MKRLLIHWLANALVLGVVVLVLHHIKNTDAGVKDVGALLLAAAVFGVLNTFLKPIIKFFTFPFAVLSLGLAWFFVSMLMLDLTQHIVSGFVIHTFKALVIGTLLVWAVNLVLDIVPGPWKLKKHHRH